MKFTEGAFKQWGYDVAHNEFAIRYLLGNNMMKLLKKMVKMQNQAQEKANKMEKSLLKILSRHFLTTNFNSSREHDVVATMNLNGDYISDALATQVGGIGIAPGANINYESGHAIFEATHGTAPKYRFKQS